MKLSFSAVHTLANFLTGTTAVILMSYPVAASTLNTPEIVGISTAISNPVDRIFTNSVGEEKHVGRLINILGVSSDLNLLVSEQKEPQPPKAEIPGGGNG